MTKRTTRAILSEEESQPIGWQAQKSASTRNLILDAAINCFINMGYAGTTTAKISQQAGLSRGAMLHHFPSKDILVKAAIEYLHWRRIEAFRQGISKIPNDHPSRIRAGLDVYWKHLTSPLFVAFHELAVASRTDPELMSIFKPAVEAFDAEWFDTARSLFPEWEPAGDIFELAMDLTQNLMEGMAINQMHAKDKKRAKKLLDWLENQLSDMLAGASDT